MPGPQFILTVKELDGTPTIHGVNTIQVSNATLSDDGGGVVTITIGTGTGNVSGTGTTNALPKWTNGAAGVIGDSLLSDDATTLAYATNKFTVAAATGNTLIAGTATISSLTSGRVPFAGTAGLLSDSANLTWTSPTLMLAGATTTGPDVEVKITGDTFSRVAMGINTADVARIGFGPGSGARDAFLEYVGAGNIKQGGTDSATPVAQISSVQNVIAGTSNTAGADRTFKGSQGTGTGAGGSIIFQTAPAGSTGTSVNALATIFTLAPSSVTVNSGSFGLSGAVSGAGIFGTSGIRYKNVASTLTDTTSSGTVAANYTNVFGANTLAASSATTITNAFNTYLSDPVAGSNVTLTNKWALGADSMKIGTSNQLTVSNAGLLTLGAQGGTAGLLQINNTSTTKAYTQGNGSWWTTPVAYLRPVDTNAGLAFDLMANGTAQNVWMDICSTDIVADSTNFECLHLGKNASSYAEVSTNKSGTGTIRNLGLQLSGGNVGVNNNNPGNKLTVNVTTIADGISLDGTNSPAYNIKKSGTIKGYWGEVTTNADYYSGSLANDTFLRSESGSRLALVVDDGSNTGVPVLITSGGAVTMNSTLAVTGASTLTGGLIGGIQALSGAGAVNVTTLSTAYTSTGVAQALTLADGTNGQIKTITHVSDGGSGVLTPTTKSGFTSVTFTNVGDAVTLQFFTTAGWIIIGQNGVIVTP